MYYDKDFRQKLEVVTRGCSERGVDVRIFSGLRSPFDQARLWCQSRSGDEIRKEVARLDGAGAWRIARKLMQASSAWASGRWATNALPGYSWHQWGEAVDFYWRVDGKAEWSTAKGGKDNGYRVLKEEAERAGLTSGGSWKVKDWVHVQLRPEPAPRMTPAEIDEAMARIWNGLFT